jgi:hypothetical protein
VSNAGAKVFNAGSIRWSWGLGKPIRAGKIQAVQPQSIEVFSRELIECGCDNLIRARLAG